MQRHPKLGPFPALARARFVDQHGRPLAAAYAPNTGGFEGGSRARRLQHWDPYASGPNAAYWGNLERMRARARDQIRNNGYATNAVETFVGNSVGTGIVPRWNLEDRALAERITACWERWVDEADADGLLNFYGLQALMAGGMFTSGESLIRLRPRRFGELEVPLQLQVLEPDYLDSSKHGDEEKRRFRLGIEFDGIGRRRAYWMFKTHPGDGLSLSLTSSPVPAEQVIHLYRVDRPGQVRGVPWLAPVLVRLHQLDTYEDAELKRKVVAAMFAAFVKEAPGSDEEEPRGIPGFESRDEERGEVTWEPGIVSYLAPGEDIQFSSPQDVGTTFEAFIRQQLRAIAVGIGLTYEQLTGDLSGVNYSSIRAGLLEFRRRIERFQHGILIHQVCRRVVNTWLDMAVASGALELPGYRENPAKYQRVEWQPPGWEWVDPLKDVTAKILEMDAELASREEVVARRGRHVEDVDREIARDRERRRESSANSSEREKKDREGGRPSVQSQRVVEMVLQEHLRDEERR